MCAVTARSTSIGFIAFGFLNSVERMAPLIPTYQINENSRLDVVESVHEE